jgi:hypothetical protein
MSDGAASETLANFPPGRAAPTAAQREADRAARLRDPDHLAKLNAARAAWLAKPKEERSRQVAEKKALKAARAAEREAKRAGKNPPSPTDSAPPTVRSQRSTAQPPPTDISPGSEIPRPGVMGGPLRGLLDLCAALPRLGDGSCFVQVVRLKPPMAFGVGCAGVQRPLWEPIDDAEFSLTYGGSEYQLRGYALREDGRSPKAMTEPVTYKVSGPPNLDSALTEEDTMRPNPAQVPNGSPGFLRRPGIVTPQAATAEADMHARELDHRETMDQRNREAEEDRRRRAEAREQNRERGQIDVVKVLADAKEKEAQRLQETYRQQLEAKGSGIAEVAELLKVFKPGDDTAALSRQHSAEIKQLTESHKEQLVHLTESHQAEMRRQSEAHAATLERHTAAHAAAMQRLDDQVRADRDRADKLIRETDQRSHEQIREAERRADQRVTDAQNAARSAYEDLKTRSEERLRDQAEAAKQRIEDMRDNHARELKRKDDELVLMRTGLEGNVAIVLANKETELKRLERELRDAKALAETNKDWVGRMKEAEQQAEALGYSKPEPGDPAADEDLKTTAVKAGLGMLQRLPEIIASGGDAISKIRNPGVPTDLARGQARSGVRAGGMRTVPRTHGGQQPPMLAPLAFATEEGGFEPVTDEVMSRPQRPQQAPPLPALEQSPSQAIVPMEAPIATPPPQPAPPAPVQAQQQSTPPPAPQATVPPPATALVPNPAVPGGLDPVAQEILLQFTPMLAQQFGERIPPEEVARQIVESNTVEMVRAALSMVTIEQLIAHVIQNPGAHSQLSSRNGQKFLRDVWRSAEQATQ